MSEIFSPNAKDIFRAHTGNAETNSLAFDLPGLRDECKSVEINNKEVMTRMETASIEIDFMEKSGMDPFDYIKHLKTQEPDIVLIEAR
jgi:hypothetical protein